MKIFILSLFATLATQAQTDMKKFYPVIGDRVYFEGAYRAKLNTLEKTLVAFHAPGLQFREVTVNNVFMSHCPNGCGPRSDKYIDANGLATHLKYKAGMEKCLKDGGEFEMVTVPAGIFDACKLKSEPRKTDRGYAIDHRWLADVPWGAAKYMTEEFKADGTLINTDTLELKEVTFGIPQ